MPKFIEPKNGETRKAYIHRAYSIGKGSGKGRISAEGHDRIREAMDKGFDFPDMYAVSAPKKRISNPAAPKKPVISVERKTEARAVDPAAIRAWAKENGHKVSERGRIAAEVTLAYLAAVPEDARAARSAGSGEKDLRAAAPRTSVPGTKWRVDFIHRGEPATMVVSDRTCCRECGISLGWHVCKNPSVATGYGDVDTAQRLTIIEPKE